MKEERRINALRTLGRLRHHMPPEGGVVAMVAPEGSFSGGSVGIVLTVGGSTGI
jgi:hypothetical protein